MRLYGTMEVNNEGVLKIGGITVDCLINKYGTPLIVLDEKLIRYNIDQYIKGLQSYPGCTRILYASKAFSNRTLYRILKEKKISLDVVSGGELYTAIKSDFPTDKIFFHGNNKLPEEINLALDNNIAGYFIDNFQEAELLNKLASKKNKKVKAMIRINPGISAHTHEYMVTGTIDSKFGVSIENGDAWRLATKIRNKYNNLKLKGIHAHIGSQIYEESAYLKLIEKMFNFMDFLKKEKDIVLSRLDLGGGLGITQNRNNPQIDIQEYVSKLVDKVILEAKTYNYPFPELALEPGRSIIGTPGTTLYTIGMIKEIDNIKKYVTVDGGMTDNIRPSLYGSQYNAFIANKCYHDNVENVTIAGKCCESGDILINNITLPIAETGDILAVTCTGAYTYSLASNYNGIPRPAVVLVNNGKSNIIIKRETYNDLLVNDIIPEDY